MLQEQQTKDMVGEPANEMQLVLVCNVCNVCNVTPDYVARLHLLRLQSSGGVTKDSVYVGQSLPDQRF